MSAARVAARVRHSEACRVVEAYTVQMQTRRKRWVLAANAAASKHAVGELTEALTQLGWAQQRERDAWHAWHALLDNE